MNEPLVRRPVSQCRLCHDLSCSLSSRNAQVEHGLVLYAQVRRVRKLSSHARGLRRAKRRGRQCRATATVQENRVRRSELRAGL